MMNSKSQRMRESRRCVIDSVTSFGRKHECVRVGCVSVCTLREEKGGISLIIGIYLIVH